MIKTIKITKNAERDLKKVPKHISLRFQAWVSLVAVDGLTEARKIKGYNDEALKGNRAGQRSIRLNKGYRAIYIIDELQVIHFIEVLEVNKHEY